MAEHLLRKAVGPDLLREGFTFDGDVCGPDSVHCLARKVSDPETGRTRYWVRACTRGLQGGHFFDPQKVHSEELQRHTPAGAIYEFRLVTAGQFDLYLRYLRTGNSSYLRLSERT